MFETSQSVLTPEAESVGAEDDPPAVDDEGGEIVLLGGAGGPDRDPVGAVDLAQRRCIASEEVPAPGVRPVPLGVRGQDGDRVTGRVGRHREEDDVARPPTATGE